MPDALFLGASGRPGWEELKQVGPIRIETNAAEHPATPVVGAPTFQRDFGDSCVACTSNGDAVAQILPSHHEFDPLRIPVALGFAFTQQWARQGLACVHGALLQVDGTGVLVLGQRAAGKSVLAASALAAGGAIVTDDYLLAGLQSDRVLGERIRGFLSLRESWASRALLEGQPDSWSPNRSGNRAFLRIADNDPRFPDHAAIDRVWILSRPRGGRRETSTLAAVGQAEVYAALVAAIQPLLLGADFPFERDRLLPLINRLVTGTRIARLETGQDVVLSPEATWRRLLAAS